MTSPPSLRSTQLDLSADLKAWIASVSPGGWQVNPYLRLDLGAAHQLEFKLSAPRPGHDFIRSGLVRTTVDPRTTPALFGILMKMMMRKSIGLSPISQAIEDELRAAAALIPEDAVPVAPVFACTVDDAELAALVAAAGEHVIRTESAGSASFGARFAAPLASPFAAEDTRTIAWIHDPLRGLDWPYWLSQEQLSTLRAPTLPAPTLPAPTRADAASFDAAVRQANSDVARCGCAIVREILPPAVLRAVASYYRDLTANGFLPFEEESGRFGGHNEPVARWLHRHTAPLLMRMIPEVVKTSYTYLGFYVAGGILDRHTDRDQCEYTLSLTIDATPHQSAAAAWPLYAELRDGTLVEALLPPGDGLLFKGRELPHFRHRLAEGRTSSSIFLHYVPDHFTGELQ